MVDSGTLGAFIHGPPPKREVISIPSTPSTDIGTPFSDRERTKTEAHPYVAFTAQTLPILKVEGVRYPSTPSEAEDTLANLGDCLRRDDCSSGIMESIMTARKVPL